MKVNNVKRPLCVVIRGGVIHFCSNCGSTMPRSGFLMLFGKRYCDNDKCPNSKAIKSNCSGAIPYDSLSDSFKKSIESIDDNLNR